MGNTLNVNNMIKLITEKVELPEPFADKIMKAVIWGNDKGWAEKGFKINLNKNESKSIT